MKTKRSNKRSLTVWLGAIISCALVALALATNVVTFPIVVSQASAVPPVSNLRIAQQNSFILLTWASNQRSTTFEVHRSTEPYFKPNAKTKLAVTQDTQYLDTTPEIIGNTSTQYFYTVLARRGRQVSVVPSYVGEWDWNILVPETATNLRAQNLELAMPFQMDDTSLNSVLAKRLVGTEDPTTGDSIHAWDNTQKTFEQAWFCDGPVCESWGSEWYQKWLKTSFEPSTMTLPAGKPFILRRRGGNQSVATLTMLGTLPPAQKNLLGGNPSNPSPGWHFISVPLNQTNIRTAAALLKAIPTADRVLKWNPTLPGYDCFSQDRNCVAIEGNARFANFPVSITDAVWFHIPEHN